ncbi:hypothetical protein ABBQ32_003315 [Trebouxia sp. C0010 RCD-2024]
MEMGTLFSASLALPLDILSDRALWRRYNSGTPWRALCLSTAVAIQADIVEASLCTQNNRRGGTIRRRLPGPNMLLLLILR